MEPDELMSEHEVCSRLHDGEDPVELSIEAWERKRQYVDEDGDSHDLSLSAHACPLCKAHPIECNECPLYKCGHPCLNVDDPSDENVYRKAWTALKSMRAHEFSKADKLEAIDAMIAALHEAKVCE